MWKDTIDSAIAEKKQELGKLETLVVKIEENEGETSEESTNKYFLLKNLPVSFFNIVSVKDRSYKKVEEKPTVSKVGSFLRVNFFQTRALALRVIGHVGIFAHF